MIDKVEKCDCVLCGGCVAVCPEQAISFSSQQHDFLYPKIDPEACVHCDLCERVCPVLEKKDRSHMEKLETYVGRNTDREIRLNSTSGGIFTALAQYILGKGGYVCGAVFDDAFHVVHIVTNQNKDIIRMSGSKYAQSRMERVYPEVKELLEQGKDVLFCGCPCQIAAIQSFLHKKYENLYLMELVCHGIPSERMLLSYQELHERKAKSKITAMQFRDKQRGWHSSSVKITFENGITYSEPITVDAYMKGFLTSVILKESCYHCAFRGFRSGCDLMLGDYWGAEVEFPDKDDNTGLSAILVHSEKGKRLLDESGVEYWPCKKDSVIQYNRNIVESSMPHPDRESFYVYADQYGYAEAIEYFFCEKKVERMKRKIRFYLRKGKHFLKGQKEPLY